MNWIQKYKDMHKQLILTDHKRIIVVMKNRKILRIIEYVNNSKCLKVIKLENKWELIVKKMIIGQQLIIIILNGKNKKIIINHPH